MSYDIPVRTSSSTSPPDLPPAYIDSTSRASITDLRAQILANASILRPKSNENRPSDDHLEVTVARYIPQPSTSKATAAEPLPARAYKYYAILVTRTRGSTAVVKIVIKGKPMQDERAALEWLLWETEDRMHRVAQTSAKGADECVVM